MYLKYVGTVLVGSFYFYSFFTMSPTRFSTSVAFSNMVLPTWHHPGDWADGLAEPLLRSLRPVDALRLPSIFLARSLVFMRSRFIFFTMSIPTALPFILDNWCCCVAPIVTSSTTTVRSLLASFCPRSSLPARLKTVSRFTTDSRLTTVT